MRKSWQVFHDRSLLLRSFWSLVFNILDRVVRSDGFLAGSVLDCNLAYRRSVPELCMLFKIMSNPMHPLGDALPLLCVQQRVTRCALVAHRHSFVPPRFRTFQYRRTFVPSRCLFGMILVTLCLMVRDCRVSRAEPMLSCWHDLLFLFWLLLFYLFLPSEGWLFAVGVFGLRECSHSLPALHSGLQMTIIIITICLI